VGTAVAGASVGATVVLGAAVGTSVEVVGVQAGC
jgi:hypothetical protein